MNRKDGKEYSKLRIGEINRKKGEAQAELMDSDLLDTKKKKQKDRKTQTDDFKTEQQKRLDDQEKKLKEAEKQKKRRLFWNPFKKFFHMVFSVSTYISIIQNFEELLLVIFIDALMLFTLGSLSYILYIMFTSSKNDDLPILIYKACAGIVVCGICLIAQANIPIASKPNKIVDEEE